MADKLPPGIDLHGEEGRVTITVEGGRWEGTPAEAERVLSGLHYALARARPNTHIVSMFINGALWGAKFFERDARLAAEHMGTVVDQLRQRVDALVREPEDPRRGGVARQSEA